MTDGGRTKGGREGRRGQVDGSASTVSAHVTCCVCSPCSAAVRGVLVRSWWEAGGEGVTGMEGEGVEGWR